MKKLNLLALAFCLFFLAIMIVVAQKEWEKNKPDVGGIATDVMNLLCPNPNPKQPR